MGFVLSISYPQHDTGHVDGTGPEPEHNPGVGLSMTMDAHGGGYMDNAFKWNCLTNNRNFLLRYEY